MKKIQDDVIIYLLFDGSSPDGRGEPDYKGRTLSNKKAKAHFINTLNPYSTGKVIAVTHNIMSRVNNIEDFE